MNIGIQNYNVAKKEGDLNNPVLTIRLNDAENIRFWHVMDAVKTRNPYVGKSDVIREILGLSPLQALTAAELNFFRTGEKTDPRLEQPFSERDAEALKQSHAENIVVTGDEVDNLLNIAASGKMKKIA